MAALIDAVKKNSIPTAATLLDFGVDVNSQDSRGLTALHYAVEHANPDMVDLLLGKNADVNIAEHDLKQTPLHRAVINGNLRVVERLMTAKLVSIELADKQGMTALDWASRSGRDDIIRLVSSKARRPNKRGAILSMADTRAPEGSPPPAISSSPGSFVAASPSFGSTSSLSASFDGGDEPVAMRQPRASTAASIANNPNRSSIFGGLRKLATSIKPPLRADAVSALVQAAKSNEVTEFTQLLNAGDDVESRDRDGNTSLFCAAELGHARIVALCIERHADVNVKNDAGWTPLHGAVTGASADHESIVQQLIGAGADLMAVNNSGETPVQLAVRRSAGAAMMHILKSASVHSSVMQLRRLAGLPNNGMDAETVAAVNMLLNHVTEQQVELEATMRYVQSLEAAGPSSAAAVAAPPPDAASRERDAMARQRSSDVLPQRPDATLASRALVKGVQCAECIQTQYLNTRLTAENAELSERSAKLMRGIAKGAQDYESRIAALEEKQRALEAEKAAVEVDRERAARRMEVSYSSKVTKMTQEMETALRKVQLELEESDQERVDLLNFQTQNKTLTWVPDDAVAFCLGPVCGSKQFDKTRRRHHCRCCGRVFCAQCVGKRVALPRMGYAKPVRVCESCFALLHSVGSEPRYASVEDGE